jgi:hypothetical protein
LTIITSPYQDKAPVASVRENGSSIGVVILAFRKTILKRKAGKSAVFPA